MPRGTPMRPRGGPEDAPRRPRGGIVEAPKSPEEAPRRRAARDQILRCKQAHQNLQIQLGAPGHPRPQVGFLRPEFALFKPAHRSLKVQLVAQGHPEATSEPLETRLCFVRTSTSEPPNPAGRPGQPRGHGLEPTNGTNEARVSLCIACLIYWLRSKSKRNKCARGMRKPQTKAITYTHVRSTKPLCFPLMCKRYAQRVKCT